MMSTILRNFQESKENEILERDLAIEVIIKRMEDGFSKIYMQLEALDERMQDVQNMSDKVDMLEASVRLLENHAFLWPMMHHAEPLLTAHPDSSRSSSSLHSSTPAITSHHGNSNEKPQHYQRSLPKRNHTIGSIKYDASAYKVSFNLQEGGSKEDLSEDDDKQRLEDYVIMHQARKRPKSCATTKGHGSGSVQEESNPNFVVVPSIVRSKSFSNDVPALPESTSLALDKHKHEHRGRWQAAHQLQLPGARTQSLRISGQKTPPGRTTRFSWNSSRESEEETLKDSKYRGSVTSLTSDVGSGATTPTPSSVKGATFDISARDLMGKKSTLLSGNLEMKKTSGFKSYKRYWAVLDSNFLYLYGRERDSKAKQVIDLTDCSITEVSAALAEAVSTTSPSSSSTGGSFRESLKKRGGRSFELVFNSGESRYFAAASKDEAEEWMRKLRLAAALQTRMFHDTIGPDLALEQDFEEEEVLRECSETGGSSGFSQQPPPRTSSVTQEWRVALKHHSPDASRFRSVQISSPL